jgi:FMN reductase
VGCIVCAEGAQAMGSTLAALRAVVHALRGWPTPFGAALNASARPFGTPATAGAPGQPADPAALQACALVADEVVQFARWHQMAGQVAGLATG